jgi:hypothetical protein
MFGEQLFLQGQSDPCSGVADMRFDVGHCENISEDTKLSHYMPINSADLDADLMSKVTETGKGLSVASCTLLSLRSGD